MTRYFPKYFLIILLSINSNCLFAYAVKTDTTNEQITYITIASEPDYPPYCFINDKGKADGFSIDLFKSAINEVGIKANIKIGVWSKIKQDLVDGEIDALPLVGRTPEREELYDFSLPYLSLHGAVFVRKGTKGINSISDLKDKQIVVMAGDNAEEFVRREKISDKIYTTHTFKEAFNELKKGRYDAVITQRVLGIKLLKEMGITSIEPLNFQIPKFRQDFCFAVKKGNAKLLSHLNEGLSIVIANRTYDELHLKWFGPGEEENISVKDFVEISVYILIPTLLFFSIITVFTLRSQVRKRTKNLKDEIIEHKKTSNILIRQQVLLNEMEIMNKMGGWEYDLEAQTFNWTDGVYKIYGVNKSEFNPNDSKMNAGFYYPDDQLMLEKAFKQTLETGEAYNLELKLRSADKRDKWVRTAGRAEKANGKIVRVFGNIIDITEHKEIERSLDETKNILQAAMNQSQAGIIISEAPSGNIRYLNTAGSEILGGEKWFSIDDISIEKYRTVWKIRDLEGNILPEEKIPILQAITKGKTSSAEIIIRRGDDDDRILLSNAAPINDHDGKIVAGIAVFLDITESQRIKQELKSLNEELEIRINQRTAELNDKIQRLNKSQKAMLYMVEDLNKVTADLNEERRKLELSNKELESFSYSVSHDLRAPLRAIQGFAGFLEEDYSNSLDDEGKRLLNIIKINTKKMDQLISDLLNLSRITRAEMQSTRVDMNSIVQTLYQESSSSEQRERFKFTVKDIPASSGDENLLRQVWANLIQNALKYSSKSDIKEIEIGSVKNDSENVYYIRDKGAGFDPKYKHKLFGVFQRLHSTTDFEGTGVGLAIVQRIVHRHNGRVWAEGEVNKGATFYFSLPASNNKNRKINNN